MSQSANTVLSASHFLRRIEIFKEERKQIDITISRCLSELSNGFFLKWEKGLIAINTTGTLDEETVKQFELFSEGCRSLKKTLKRLQEAKARLSDKIDTYERYILHMGMSK